MNKMLIALLGLFLLAGCTSSGQQAIGTPLSSAPPMGMPVESAWEFSLPVEKREELLKSAGAGDYARTRALWNVIYGPAAVDSQGRTLMMFAAGNGFAKILEKDLTRENAQAVDQDGRSALSYAAYNGREDALRVLLKGGATPDQPDKAGRTALMHAAARGHYSCVALLLDHGADPSLTDREGMAAPNLAWVRKQDQKMLDLFNCFKGYPSRDFWDKIAADGASLGGLCLHRAEVLAPIREEEARQQRENKQRAEYEQSVREYYRQEFERARMHYGLGWDSHRRWRGGVGYGWW